jgi:menaquinone-dependent protoporphyrinogen IX oxidase
MTTKNETKGGFIAKVLARLTGGDEAKVTRFQTKVVKSLTTQVNIRKAEIEDLKEKVADQQEKYEDVLVTIDLDAIKTTEGVDGYIPRYVSSLSSVKKQIKSYNDQIAAKEAEIEGFEALVADLKG